jgi:hypothetical protein
MVDAPDSEARGELRLGDGDLLQRGDVELLEHLPDECSDGAFGVAANRKFL